jgi:hypothetical protein
MVNGLTFPSRLIECPMNGLLIVACFGEPNPKTSCPYKKGISEVIDEYIVIQPYR